MSSQLRKGAKNLEKQHLFCNNFFRTLKITHLIKYVTVSSNFLISEAWDVLSSFIRSCIYALLDCREFNAFTASYH